MANDLNITAMYFPLNPNLIGLFPKRHPLEISEEFEKALLSVYDVTDNGLGQRIYELAGRLSVATILSQADAISFIRDLIEIRVKNGMPADDAIREVFTYVTDTYLCNNRPETDMNGGENG